MNENQLVHEEVRLRTLFAKNGITDKTGKFVSPMQHLWLDITDEKGIVIYQKNLNEADMKEIEELTRDSTHLLTKEWRSWCEERQRIVDAIHKRFLDVVVDKKNKVPRGASFPFLEVPDNGTVKRRRYNFLCKQFPYSVSVSECDEFYRLANELLNCSETSSYLAGFNLLFPGIRKLVTAACLLRDGGVPMPLSEELCEFSKSFSLTPKDLSDLGAIFRNTQKGLVTTPRETVEKNTMEKEILKVQLEDSQKTSGQLIQHLAEGYKEGVKAKETLSKIRVCNAATFRDSLLIHKRAGGNIQNAAAAILYAVHRSQRKVGAAMGIRPNGIGEMLREYERVSGCDLGIPTPGKNFGNHSKYAARTEYLQDENAAKTEQDAHDFYDSLNV